MTALVEYAKIDLAGSVGWCRIAADVCRSRKSSLKASAS